MRASLLFLTPNCPSLLWMPAQEQNKAGSYILASQSDPKLSVPRTLPPSAASWAAVDLIGKSGSKSWPITSFVYILARKNQVQVS